MFFLITAFIFSAGFLHAAPLENNFTSTSISPSEARSRVIAAAGTYEHTPYRYGGLDRRGLDCSGLVYLSFHDALGVSVPRNTRDIYSWAEKIQIENALPGDLVFFRTTGKKAVSHVGIFVGGKRFIHAASDGPATGVIYSSLDERYWSRTYIGAGRVLPEAAISIGDDDKKAAKKKSSEKTKESENGLLLGFAVAPSWNTFFSNGTAIRGVAGQLRLGVAVKPFGQPMIFGMELRPEWDRLLGVFRLPFTFSWGINDKYRLFAGPVLSFGDAVLAVSGGNRQYTGGTSWFGAAGITIAPFIIKIAKHDLAPYGELAWQSYFSDNNDKNLGADFAAGFRISTGIRYTWRR